MVQAKTEVIGVPGSLDEAMRRAMAVVAETHREQMPVRLFKQGERQMVSGVMPVKVALRILTHNSAEKGMTADEALHKTNRPFMKDHAEGFLYLVSARRTRASTSECFRSSPLTLNAPAI